MASWDDPEVSKRWLRFADAYMDWSAYAGNDSPGEVFLFRIFDHIYMGNDEHARILLSNVWLVLCNAWHEVRAEHCVQEQW